MILKRFFLMETSKVFGFDWLKNRIIHQVILELMMNESKNIFFKATITHVLQVGERFKACISAQDNKNEHPSHPFKYAIQMLPFWTHDTTSNKIHFLRWAPILVFMRFYQINVNPENERNCPYQRFSKLEKKHSRAVESFPLSLGGLFLKSPSKFGDKYICQEHLQDIERHKFCAIDAIFFRFCCSNVLQVEFILSPRTNMPKIK